MDPMESFCGNKLLNIDRTKGGKIMTTGQMLFYGGAVLLALTIVLAIIFVIVKPKYKPENGTYASEGPGITQKLLNGYPTDRMTIRRETATPSDSAISKSEQETELMSENLTIPIYEDKTSDL